MAVKGKGDLRVKQELDRRIQYVPVEVVTCIGPEFRSGLQITLPP